MEFVRPATGLEALKGEDTMLIMSRHGEGDAVERGRRILKVVKYGKTMARGGDLNASARRTVEAIKRTFELSD